MLTTNVPVKERKYSGKCLVLLASKNTKASPLFDSLFRLASELLPRFEEMPPAHIFGSRVNDAYSVKPTGLA
jgi:hypothetical protein